MIVDRGTKLGPYEILEPLGTGGMGEVYKGQDTRLNRFVAIKVLRPEYVSDDERKQRFIHEAKAVSALNHPNIVTIYDICSESGRDFLVMEYVQGKTLDALIRRTGMRFSELLRIAVQIADGLSAAHAAGIIHRDLKPSNIIVPDSGPVKILDFGLAKLTARAKPTEDDETQTLRAKSMEGVVLGTAAYMSPEQAKGQAVDARTDIFSFGAVLYEMATGRRAFPGRSTAEIVAAVVGANPPGVTEVVPGLPGEFERIVMRCLRKDEGRRQQHMSDVKVLLEELKEESESGNPQAAFASKTRLRRLWVAVVALVLTMATGAALWITRGRGEPPPRVVPLTTFAGTENCAAFSPDGNQVVFTWNGEKQDNWDLYVKMIGGATALRLTSDPAPESFPAWSPDGRQIAFLKFGPGGGIYLISPLGGSQRKIADFDAANLGAPAWSPNGKFLVAAKSNDRALKAERDAGALYLVPVQGGEPRPLLIPNSGWYNLYPAFDPTGRSLAFASCSEIGSTCDITLVALTHDFLPEGRPRQIRRIAAQLAGLAWAADGRSLVYSAGTSINDHLLWRLDVAGAEAKRLEIASEGAMFPAVASKGFRLAFARLMTDQDIWRVDAGGKPEPLLVSSMLDMNAQFSPDGRRIAFASGRSVDRVAIWVSDANGANLVQLTTGPGTYDGSPRWSPDGHWIAFDALGDDGRRSVEVVESTGGQPRHLTTGFPWSSKVPSWSRDGKWIYFTSDRTGGWEIWRIPSSGGAAEQITTDGGYVALESADGKTLFYTKTGSYGGVPLYARTPGSSEERQVVEAVAGRGFDVAGDRIYYIAQTGPRTAEIRFHELATGRSRLVSTIEEQPGLGLSVSPDRKTLLFSKFVSGGTDLMLIENFR